MTLTKHDRKQVWCVQHLNLLTSEVRGHQPLEGSVIPPKCLKVKRNIQWSWIEVVGCGGHSKTKEKDFAKPHSVEIYTTCHGEWKSKLELAEKVMKVVKAWLELTKGASFQGVAVHTTSHEPSLMLAHGFFMRASIACQPCRWWFLWLQLPVLVLSYTHYHYHSSHYSYFDFIYHMSIIIIWRLVILSMIRRYWPSLVYDA